MATIKSTSGQPMEFRQRRLRQTANPVISNKPDVYLDFNTSKLGIRVRSGPNKHGLYVAAVTNEAPPEAKAKIPDGAQIISVNDHFLENVPFDEAVEHFAQLSLPISVRFRPPLYPPKRNTSQSHSHNHDHDHDHDHHHHHDDDDDESEGTCYIACYMILFVLLFMFIVSVSLNGFPGLPTSLPSMPRLFPNKSNRRNRKNRRSGSGSSDNSDSASSEKINIKDQLRQKVMDNNNNNKNNRKLMDIVGDMNNIHNILNDVDINLNDIDIDELAK